MTIIGIYGCTMPVGLLPPTATCYKLTSFSAPCEWLLALCWIVYLFALGYDLYHAETVAAQIISLTSVGHKKSPSAAMRELRLAKVLEGDREETAYKPQYAMTGKSKYASVQAHEVDNDLDEGVDLGLVDGSSWVRAGNKEFV
jgi:hypothetical protein